MNTVLRSTSLLVLGSIAACGGQMPTPKPGGHDGAVPVAAGGTAGEAQAQFDSLCFTCHGATGHGDGPGSGVLNPKPRSFSDPTWQASVTDEHIKKTIVFGGAAVGKSPMMPAQPQLKGKDATLDALVQIVRNFKAK
ncbi:MAG: c-type cytochrome [Planctomycetota bacterium]